jgi:multiple sugar transport system substrate-binding protein
MKNRALLRRSFALCIAAAILLLLTGCPEKQAASPAQKTAARPPQPLTVLVVDDPPLGQAIAREWRGRTEQELTVRDVSLADVLAANRLPGDAVVFPSGVIGHLAERGLISALESTLLEDAEFNYRDIFDQIRLGEMRWGRQTVAVPLGSPQLLLAYRADAFEKENLKPPADWNEYQQIVERLQVAPIGAAEPSTIEPLAPGWAGQLLFARAASYALHREQVSPLFQLDSMTPLIDQPPYVRALEELVAAAKTAGYAGQRLDPAEVFKKIRSGNCAMAIAWAVTNTADQPSVADANLRFSALPGSNQAYRFATKSWEPRGEGDEPRVPLRAISGRMVAATASSSDTGRAQGFVIWLAGRDVSQQVGPHSDATTLFRHSQIATSTRWTGSLAPEVSRQYSDVLDQSLSLPRGFGLTLPGRPDYLAVIDQAVQQALDGNPAQDALAEAAKKWTEITKKFGLDAQIRANAHSLGQGDR